MFRHVTLLFSPVTSEHIDATSEASYIYSHYPKTTCGFACCNLTISQVVLLRTAFSKGSKSISNGGIGPLSWSAQVTYKDKDEKEVQVDHVRHLKQAKLPHEPALGT